MQQELSKHVCQIYIPSIGHSYFSNAWSPDIVKLPSNFFLDPSFVDFIFEDAMKSVGKTSHGSWYSTTKVDSMASSNVCGEWNETQSPTGVLFEIALSRGVTLEIQSKGI